ncbi:MAG: hypothetical protein AB1921_18285 [Thermodesulfobacteriota bacterium]
MKFQVLLFALAQLLKVSSLTNKEFKKRIANVHVRLLFRTRDGQTGRLIVFDRGKIRSFPGAEHSYDAALVFKDAATGFSVMKSREKDAMFNAAAQGDMYLLGMSAWAVWLEDVMKLVM